LKHVGRVYNTLSYTYVCEYVGFGIISNNILFTYQRNKGPRH